MPGLLYIGSHGLVWWYEGADELPVDALPYVALAEHAVSEFAPMRAIPWLRVEEKGVGIAFHYRLAPDLVDARANSLTAIADAPAARHFEVREGICLPRTF